MVEFCAACAVLAVHESRELFLRGEHNPKFDSLDFDERPDLLWLCACLAHTDRYAEGGLS